MWGQLIKRYWQVSIFKETPAHTPYSIFLLSLIAVFFLCLIIFQWIIADNDQSFSIGSAIETAVALLFSYGLYTAALLLAYRLPSRIVQTLTCILAGHAIVHLCAFPLLVVTPWISSVNLVQPFNFLLGILYILLTLILTVWQFMVTVHIYKHSLMIHYFPAVLASIGLVASNILIVSLGR